jgi:hypothetical protein
MYFGVLQSFVPLDAMYALVFLLACSAILLVTWIISVSSADLPATHQQLGPATTASRPESPT